MAEEALEELQSLAAIYPEAEIDLSNKSGNVQVFLQINDPVNVTLINSDKETVLETQVINCPALEFSFVLTEGYPYDNPPQIKIKANWISQSDLKSLTNELLDIWSDMRDASIFTMVDHIRTYGADTIDVKKIELESQELYDQFIELDKSMNRREFDLTPFTCEICQDEKKGKVSIQLDCGHMFCKPCLVEYFKMHIEKGSVENIHCPSHECRKKYVTNRNAIVDNMRNLVISSDKDLSQLEKALFQLPLDKDFLATLITPEELERFLSLFHKTSIATYQEYFPLKVAECGRSTCGYSFIRKDVDDQLCICPKCKMAFCFKCGHSWHGTLNACSRADLAINLPEEEIEKWIDSFNDAKNGPATRMRMILVYGRQRLERNASEYTTEKMFDKLIFEERDFNRCPKCKITVERMEGCNKMKCPKCSTSFCNLCGEFLPLVNPYDHFTDPMSLCYGKLFDGIETVTPDAGPEPLLPIG